MLALWMLSGCSFHTRVAIGPTWHSGAGAAGFGGMISVSGAIGKTNEDDRPEVLRSAALTGGVESAVTRTAPQASPVGAHLGLDSMTMKNRWAVGAGVRASATMVAPPVAFLGRAGLHLDVGWLHKNHDFFGFGVEGGVQFGNGIGGQPTAGFLFAPFVFRHVALPGAGDR